MTIRRALPAALLAFAMTLSVPVLARAEAEKAVAEKPKAEPVHESVSVATDTGAIVERTYVRWMPEKQSDDERLPLVILLHGAGGNGESFLKNRGWIDTAREARFVVASLDALPVDPTGPINRLYNPRLWNAGQPSPRAPSFKPDDISFIRAVAAHLIENDPIDPARVHLVGFGNGGSMALAALVARRSEDAPEFAGVASVAGPLHKPVLRPLAGAVYVLSGSVDPIAPIAGGTVHTPWASTIEVPPIEQTVSVLRQGLTCKPGSATVETDGPTTRRLWTDCGETGALAAIVVEDLGHHWPGTGPGPWPARIVGPPSDAIFAPWDIWTFFEGVRAQHLAPAGGPPPDEGAAGGSNGESDHGPDDGAAAKKAPARDGTAKAE